jgi:hypothetical protein
VSWFIVVLPAAVNAPVVPSPSSPSALRAWAPSAAKGLPSGSGAPHDFREFAPGEAPVAGTGPAEEASVDAPNWYTLGFTGDDIVGAWQHWRLADEFRRAFLLEGKPPGIGVLESPGQGEHLLYWYVRADVATMLDRHVDGWRRFVVRTDLQAPDDAHPALKETA